MLLPAVFAQHAATAPADTRQVFRPGTPTWTDTDGEPINAHGGGILEHDDTYYWYGEQRGTDRAGARCYSSKNLHDWKDEGVVLPASDDPASDFRVGATMERPKVIYNAKTGKFVMWFHLELAGMGYDAARTGVAVADSPTGPFTYLRSMRLHPGRLPVNAPVKSLRDRDEWAKRVDALEGRQARWAEGEIFLRDLAVGQMSRDMTLYVDDDAAAYHVTASEENGTLIISKLTDDYLDLSAEFSRALPRQNNEAPVPSSSTRASTTWSPAASPAGPPTPPGRRWPTRCSASGRRSATRASAGPTRTTASART